MREPWALPLEVQAREPESWWPVGGQSSTSTEEGKEQVKATVWPPAVIGMNSVVMAIPLGVIENVVELGASLASR